MIYAEDDINFDTLTDGEFEEMCLDLLLRLGFHSHIWRLGGADNGRDIEVNFSVVNPLVPSYTEKWFIECKRHSTGINVTDLDTKIAWANAERPNHLVFITSSYLTNNTRVWLEKIIDLQKPFYKIHCIEGKALKYFLIKFQDITAKYFGDKYSKLLRVSREAWQSLDIVPEAETLFLLYKNLDPRRLTSEELAFLWCMYHLKSEELEEWCSDPFKDILPEDKPFPVNYLFNYLLEKGDKVLQPIFQTDNFGTSQSILLNEGTLTIKPKRLYKAIYVAFLSSREGLLEVLIKYDKNFSVKIRWFNVSQLEKLKRDSY